MRKTVLISGGTGLIGRRLTEFLESDGHIVRILTRNKKLIDGIKYFHWNIPVREIDLTAFDNINSFIHLVGAGIIDKKWTSDRKQEILQSRTESLKLIAQLQADGKIIIPHIISASGTTIYGFHPSNLFQVDSNHQAGGFAQTVCYAWEKAIVPFQKGNLLWNIIRIGFVLSKYGGALPEIKKGVRSLGYTYFGNGKQWVSWIHIDDLCRLFLVCIDNASFQNKVLNGVAPSPAMNKAISKQLAKHLNCLALGIPTPKFIMRLILGDRAELILKGNKVSPKVQLDLGFQYKFSNLSDALKDIYH